MTAAPCHARACLGGALYPQRIGRSDDAAERDADRMAGAALRRTGGDWSAAASQEAPADRPLSAIERAFFEPRFDHDFSNVRLHADGRAADAAAALHTRAFTLGSDISFGAGQYRPATPEGRALIAHELAHVVQASRGSADAATLRRAPLTTAGRNIDFVDRIAAFQFVISAQPAAFGDIVGRIEPGVADLTEVPVRPQDVFTMQPRFSEGGDLTGRLRWELPPELEKVLDVGDHGIHVRVAADAQPSVVEAKVGANDSPRMMTIRIAIDALPAGAPDVVDPRLAANAQARAAVAEERRTSREQYGALSRDERREQRQERREERRSLRSQARVLRRERRLLERDCNATQQGLIDAALARAIEVCSAAVIAAQGGAAQPRLAGALERYFKIAAADVATPAAAKTLQRIADTLAVARNSMLTAGLDSFDCVSCQESTGAYVTSDRRGGSTVRFCPKWLHGIALTFDPVSGGVDDARAYALLHEYVHLSGPGDDPEKYVSDDGWAGVSAQQAIGMADAYAALAWRIGGER